MKGPPLQELIPGGGLFPCYYDLSIERTRGMSILSSLSEKHDPSRDLPSIRPRRNRRRNWIFCIVMGLLCIALYLAPTPFPERVPANATREKVRILSVDNSQLMPLGIVYSGAQEAEIEVLSGPLKGAALAAVNHLNASLDKDKLFAPGDTALCIVHAENGKATYATLIDHYRMETQGFLFLLFFLFLILFGGVSGFGTFVSLAASILVIWKVLIPLLLLGWPPIVSTFLVVVLLSAIIMYLVGGLTRMATVSLLGSLLGTALTCILAVAFGNALKLDGGDMPYVVPLLSQAGLRLDIKDLFFSMVFLASSGALMDLAMDMSAAVHEVLLHHPDITRAELIKSGFRVGRSVTGTMTTTLMLAYSGSFLSMLMYFMGQGTPVIDLINYKFVATEILNTLVGTFGLVTVAPFTVIAAGFLYVRPKR